MDYQEAQKLLLHGRTGRPMIHKHVGHRRLLRSLNEWPSGFCKTSQQTSEPCIVLNLYGSYVLALGEKGDVGLWAGTWKTNTTMRGINDYLPLDWRVRRAWPGNHWYVRTPVGNHFFYDYMRLTAEGVDENRKMRLPDGRASLPDACVFEMQALDYAKELTQQFCTRTMTRMQCSAARCINGINEESMEEVRGVMYEHVQGRVPCANIIRLAFRGASTLLTKSTVLNAGFADTEHLHRTPRNQLEYAKRADAQLSGYDCDLVTLWNLRKDIWEAIRNYVLEPFGYEIT